MRKNSIIRGTLILTLAGIITRLIGFFYRIYLSNTLGAENLGIYQLIFPIYGICFTLYASGIQTAISQLVAAEVGKKSKSNLKRILCTGGICSFTIALCLSSGIYFYADKIAKNIILEPACASSLKVLAIVFPFCGITACINGYYYGLKKTAVPAATQLLEQIIRVISVYLIAMYAGGGNRAVTCELAVLGVVLGEIASNIYNVLSLIISDPEKKILPASLISLTKRRRKPLFLKQLAKLSLPLTGSRLIISILHSVEAILIPSMLKKYGLGNAEALSLYGILIGMSIPFILFPSTITNSLAVLLLPTVSEAQAVHNDRMIEKTTATSIKFSLLIGLLSTAVFIIFGENLGILVFHNQTSGAFLVTLSWLCPFLYLSTTLSSIINGLGKTHLTFFNTTVGLAIRILFIIYLVPFRGITGYLIGMLVSQLAIALLDYLAVSGSIHVNFNATDWLLKPCLILVFTGFIVMKAYQYLSTELITSPLLLMFLCCLALTICYTVLLFILKSVTPKEFQ